MGYDRLLNRLITRLCVAIVVLAETVYAAGPCSVPHYRMGRVFEDTPAEVSLQINIRLEDFAPGKLICLAAALRQKYPERSVWAAIFSSHEAALNYSMQSIEQTPKSFEYQSRFHGIYSYDKASGDDHLLIVPDGHSMQVGSPLNTRIDLPVTSTVTCRLAINSRCLLEFQRIDYPTTDDNVPVSGLVTLAGNIRPDGTVLDIAVADAKASPSERQSVLTNWASRNLSTWRFEPSNRKEPLRITYVFEVSDSSSGRHETRVQFRLPSEVRIELAPRGED